MPVRQHRRSFARTRPFGSRTRGRRRRARRLLGLSVAAVLAAWAFGTVGATASFAQPSGRLEHTVKHKRRHRHHKKKKRAKAASPSSPCADASTPAARASTQAIDGAVICLINVQRNERGLPSLHEQSQLDNSAQQWSDWMVTADQFTHGTNFAARIAASGYTFQAAGEDIASGYSTPLGVVNAWMASTGHCENILRPIFNDVGAGVDPRAVSAVASGGATWTVDFGQGLLAPAPSSNWGPADGCPY
jgi:uncharacterized protein YkwD